MRTVNTAMSYCRAGASRSDITPPVGIYHRMWGAATHERSTGVHRPLTASVLIVGQIANPQKRADHRGIVLVVLDHCILAETDIASIRRCVAAATSFPAEVVHVSLTHTHGAGLMMRDRTALPGGEMIVPYLEDVARRVGQLAAQAERSLQLAWITYGVGRCDMAADRDFFDEDRGGYVCGFNPSKAADDTMVVARVTAQTGPTIATIVNYACHPTTLAWDNTLISPDYVGAMREVIESAMDAAPCLFLQGASGELGPRDGFVGDVAVADRNGRRLGHAALAALEALPPAGTRFDYRGPVVSGAVLGTWAHVALDPEAVCRAARFDWQAWTVNLAYRPDLPGLAETREKRQRQIADEETAQRGGDIAAARILHAQVEQLTRQIMRLEALPAGDAYPLPVAVWQLGDAIWINVAGEHYSALQTTLRRRFPNVPIIVATITNGWQPGYLPTAESYGKGIYQESIAMVAAGSLEKLVDEIAMRIEPYARSESDAGV